MTRPSRQEYAPTRTRTARTTGRCSSSNRLTRFAVLFFALRLLLRRSIRRGRARRRSLRRGRRRLRKLWPRAGQDVVQQGDVIQHEERQRKVGQMTVDGSSSAEREQAGAAEEYERRTGQLADRRRDRQAMATARIASGMQIYPLASDRSCFPRRGKPEPEEAEHVVVVREYIGAAAFVVPDWRGAQWRTPAALDFLGATTHPTQGTAYVNKGFTRSAVPVNPQSELAGRHPGGSENPGEQRSDLVPSRNRVVHDY